MLKNLILAASMLLIGYNQKTCVEKETWLKGGKKKVGNIFDPKNSQKFDEKAPNFLGGVVLGVFSKSNIIIKAVLLLTLH